MLKIGAFSKLSLLTVKTLRFYDKTGLLTPAGVDSCTGYRFYEVWQLETAAKIKEYRSLSFSIEEIKAIFQGANEKQLLLQKREELLRQKSQTEFCLSRIQNLLEGKQPMYTVVEKIIPSCIVYSCEKRLKHVSEQMTFIPECGAACKALNPDIRCAEPAYEFSEYPDEVFHQENVLIRHNEAVTSFGNESEFVKFREIPVTKVLSIQHKGAYELLGQAYAFLMKYAEDNGYKASGLTRECYIDGIWNKDSVEDWLTEIQLPIE